MVLFKAGFIYFTENITAVKLLNWSSSSFVLSKRVNNRKSIGVVFYLCFYTFYTFALSGLMFYLCYLFLFTHTVVQHDFNIRWCSCRLTVTRRVKLLSGCTYILLDIHGQFTVPYYKTTKFKQCNVNNNWSEWLIAA